MHITKMVAASALAILIAMMAACGGKGGSRDLDSGSAHSTSIGSSTAQGAYTGTTSAGYDFQTIILDNDEYYTIYYGQSLNGMLHVAGFIQGNGRSSKAGFTSSNLRGFYGSTVSSGSLTASYIPAASFKGTIVEGHTTSTFFGDAMSTLEFNYNTPANLARITGTWQMEGADGKALMVTIGTDGNLSGSSGGCVFNGSLKPRLSGKNVFDMNVTFGDYPCALVNQSASGIAVESSPSDGTQRLIVLGLDAARSKGAIIFGSRISSRNGINNIPSRVSPIVEGNAALTVGQTADITLSFYSNDGNASNLQVTADLASLPAGWSAMPSPFACISVPPSGPECQFTLSYDPIADTSPTVLEIPYTYTDDEGQRINASASISYAATSADSGVLAPYAYLTQRGTAAGNSRILKCIVASDGSLSGCADAGLGAILPGPASIALSGSNAYVLNQPADTAVPYYSIWKCSVSADGLLSGCADSGAAETSHVNDLAVNGNHAYTLVESDDRILHCNVDTASGAISNCGDDAFGEEVNTNIAATLHEPVNLVVAGNRMYVVNSDLENSSASLCTLSQTGVVTKCEDANSSIYDFNPESGGTAPTGIALKGLNAYIVSSANGNVIRCAIGRDGKFSTCAEDAVAEASPSGLNRIAINGKYAYISQASKAGAANPIIECRIADGTGALQACAPAITEAASLSRISSEIVDIKFLSRDARLVR